MSGVRTLFAALLAVMLASGCGSDGDGSDRDRTDQRRADAPTETTDEDAADSAPEPSGTDSGEAPLPPIAVTSPLPLETVVGSFLLEGSAQVHEGTLAWAILDASGRPMARGTTTAGCGAPCRGEFSTRIWLTNVDVGSWELHVWSPNVADEGPRRLHDTMVPITVATEHTPGAPPPGTPPPGPSPNP